MNTVRTPSAIPMPSNIATSRRDFIQLSGGVLLGTLLPDLSLIASAEKPDVCIYGATASGIMAAVAATKEGARVVIVEPSRWLGGMTGGGL